MIWSCLSKPDFHRLDRTSFVLAHLFDHLIGEREQCWRNGEAEYPCKSPTNWSRSNMVPSIVARFGREHGSTAPAHSTPSAGPD
jgi:hypothetical protein